jgi:hypothetical protein
MASNSQQAKTAPVAGSALSKLVWVGPLTIVAAVAANTIIGLIAVTLLNPDPGFIPLTVPVPAVFTLAGVLGAVAVYAALVRFARKPVEQFRKVAMIALVASFVPDILMLLTGFNPGTTLANVVVLIVMHVVAWAITVGMLTRLAPAEA